MLGSRALLLLMLPLVLGCQVLVDFDRERIVPEDAAVDAEAEDGGGGEPHDGSEIAASGGDGD